MRNLIDDYKLPDYLDESVSETEFRAACQVITDNIARLRAVRHNYEQVLAKRYVTDLDEGNRRSDLYHSRPYIPDLRESTKWNQRNKKYGKLK